jgi:hypothetical protein
MQYFCVPNLCVTGILKEQIMINLINGMVSSDVNWDAKNHGLHWEK